MNISFESKGDFSNVISWLKKVSTRNPSVAVSKLADEGTSSLRDNTPRETGQTAAGWKSEVKVTGDTVEIAWKNTAHPELEVNMAKLIDLGHGTGTGGYVPPKPYIKKAMEPVWKDVDNVVKEMIK